MKIDGDKVYADARALCYGAAMEAAPPFERRRLEDFTVVERRMIDRIAEWMGSRDCDIAQLLRIASELVTEATMATNALGCVARAQYQQAEVARLHTAIHFLKGQLAPRLRAAKRFTMPGPVSESSKGPGEATPYVPSWCYPKGARLCPCGHHEGYHDDNGRCLLDRECKCKGLPADCVTPLDEM